MSPYWEAVENTYIDSSKTVFRKVRDEREVIIRYFYQIRQDFLEYLRRPDHKQEFVSQFQKVSLNVLVVHLDERYCRLVYSI